jgi:2-dehydropantoate 2-reductase
MNICVLGAGAIGGWIAAKLAASGNLVTALTSRGSVDQIEIDENGVGRQVQLAPGGGPADVLVIAVKAPSLAAVSRSARTWINRQTLIVPVLNGVPWWFLETERLKSVDPDGSAAASFPFDQLIGCVVHASCYRRGPNSIVVNHSDRLIIGEPRGGTSERSKRLFSLFDAADLNPEISPAVRREVWYKLWGNATINPLSAITRATSDKILADPECRAWMLDGMCELERIGDAIGCPITESGDERMAVTARLGAFRTSMLQDVEASRPIELEALLGAPREIARLNGIQTPALDRLYGITRLTAESLGLV